MFPGKAIIGVALVLLSAVTVLAPSAGATKPCPVDYCTDSNGEYVLEVPPLTFIPAFADCVWDAHVEFGDGTSADYVFDAAVGLTGSHVFATPGLTYTVEVVLSEGHHGETADPCQDIALSPEVRYRTPAEEADDPPAPEEPIDEGGAHPPLIPVAADPQTPNPQTPPDQPAAGRPPAEPTSYWQRCRGGVLTHMVGCGKGLAVAREARARLTGPGTARANGFGCHLPRGPAQSIVCRRGAQGVIAPSHRRDRG